MAVVVSAALTSGSDGTIFKTIYESGNQDSYSIKTIGNTMAKGLIYHANEYKKNDERFL